MAATNALSDSDRARVRRHLGYPNVSMVPTRALGVPALSQPLYLVESAMDRLLPEAADYVRQVIDVMEGIQAQIVDANRRLKAQQLGELKLRRTNDEPTEQELLWGRYGEWATVLSDELAAPINPYSAKFRQLGLAGYGGMQASTPVMHPGR